MSESTIERSHFPNGQLRWEGSFKGGKLEGKNRHWHENGQLSKETSYKNGLEHGEARQWNKDGKLLGKYCMEHGSGVERQWYENGQIEREAASVRGQLCGRFRCWAEDGELVSTNYYIRDKKVSKKKYIEACKIDPALPRYEDDGSELEEPQITGTYQKRETPAPEWDRHKHDEFIKEFLRKPNRGKARQWLKGDEKRFIGEMSHEDSVEFVEDGYKAGATKIIAVEIEDETTNCLIVYLPPAGPKREQVFKWNSEFAQRSGWDPYDDWGQNELFVFFD